MQALTLDQVRSAAPAAFTERHEMSDRYAQIQTSALLERLMSEGFQPVDASQDSPRSRDPKLVTHLITLRHESLISNKAPAGSIPQLLLMNSHNGRTKCRLYGGFFRFACCNGMIVGDTTTYRDIRHTGDALVEASVAATEVSDALREVGATINGWKEIELSRQRATAFARKAAVLRFGEASAKAYAPADILTVRRPEDEGDDLWHVFNRVQENTTQGGLKGASATGRVISSRPLNAIQSNVEYNRELWALAERVAEAA